MYLEPAGIDYLIVHLPQLGAVTIGVKAGSLPRNDAQLVDHCSNVKVARTDGCLSGIVDYKPDVLEIIDQLPQRGRNGRIDVERYSKRLVELHVIDRANLLGEEPATGRQCSVRFCWVEVAVAVEQEVEGVVIHGQPWALALDHPDAEWL